MYEVREVARVLRLAEATTRAWINQKRISAVRIGSRTMRIPAAEVERLIAEGTIPPRGVGGEEGCHAG